MGLCVLWCGVRRRRLPESWQMQENQKHSLSTYHPNQGSIEEVLRVAWPIIVGVLSYTAMGVADTFYVGFLGTTSLAAVGLATTVVLALNAFFLGTLDGVKVVASQAFGANEHDRVQASAWHGLMLALPLGVLALGTLFLDGWIFELMGGPIGVREQAQQYFDVRIWGAPCWYFMITLCNVDKAVGDTKTPMMLTLAANVINIILNACFIFGAGPIPSMGVEGAAWATVFSSMIGMSLAVVIFVWRRGIRPVWRQGMTLEILKLGLPMGVEFGLDMACYSVITSMIAHMGEAQLAANQIAIRIMSVSFMPGYGISEAACILAGQYAGAKNPRAIHRVFWTSMVLSMAFMGGVGVVFWLAPVQLLGLFQASDAVLACGVPLLYLAAVLQVFDAVAMVAMGTLNGLGDTRYTMVVSIITNWLVMLPISYVLGVVMGYGLLGVWVGVAMMVVAIAALDLSRFIQGGWRKHHQMP